MRTGVQVVLSTGVQVQVVFTTRVQVQVVLTTGALLRAELLQHGAHVHVVTPAVGLCHFGTDVVIQVHLRISALLCGGEAGCALQLTRSS